MARLLTETESFATLADRLIVLTKDGTLEYYGAPETGESLHRNQSMYMIL